MPTYDFTAVGFLLVDVLTRYADEMPPPGGAIMMDEGTMAAAGTAGATAVDCAILGLRGQISARVGQDVMAEFLFHMLKKYGVGTDLIQRDSTVQTSMSMLPIRPDGSRGGFFVKGTCSTFLPSEGDIDRIVDANIVHLGGTGLLDAFDGAPSAALLKRAKEAGCKTVFDLILAGPETAELVVPLLPYIDYFVPSIVESGAMSGESEPDAIARWFRERGARNVMLTQDVDGVFVLPEKGEAFHQPAHRIDVIDSTGCGDSFSAGVIVGLHNGWDIRQCARFANAVAAQVALGLGSQGTLKSFESALEFMKKRPLYDGQ